MLILAWRNIWRNRRRTLITLAAIALSVTLVQAFHNLSYGVYQSMIAGGVRAGSGHLTIYRKGYVDSRDERLSWRRGDLAEQAAALPGVEAVLPRVYLPGMAQSSRESRGILLTGIDPRAERPINPFLKGLDDTRMIRSLSGRDALVGFRLLKELKLKPGRKFVVTVQNRSGDLASELFRVRGVITTGLKDVDGRLIMVGLKKAAAMAGIGGEIHELAIILDQPRRDRDVGPALEKLIHNRRQLVVIPWDRAMPNLANAIKLDYASQKFIFAIILLIVTIGVVNTQLMSVMERYREFGIILAVGATAGRLRLLVLTESLIIGLSAMLLGSALGSLATLYLSRVGIDLRSFVSESLEFGGVIFDPVLRAAWDFGYMTQIACYVVILSLLAALYPARKAGRIQPAEAMRKI
ncbi:ABC transporter permease [Geothermobacter hydrogeniphilus]|nr:FtsX-like permease family protein [Geothermobacter hydrogeniphilus]